MLHRILPPATPQRPRARLARWAAPAIALLSATALAGAGAAPAGAAQRLYGWGPGGVVGLGPGLDAVQPPTPIVGVDSSAATASTATAAAIGGDRSFLLTPSGVYGTGLSFGLASPTSSLSWNRLPGTGSAKAVATGRDTTLIVRADGTVVGFGTEEQGATGRPLDDLSATPVPIAGLSSITAVAAGIHHSLALDSDGQVWAWGAASALGSSAVVDTPTPAPVSLPTGRTATKISAGFSHSLALLDDGSVWAWGSGTSGELGNGALDDALTPVRAIAPPAAGAPHVVAVSAGLASSFALFSDGTFKAWGASAYLGLGLGIDDVVTTPTAPKPSTVTALPARFPALAAISAVGATTFAITKDDRHVLVWGSLEAGLGGSGDARYDYAFPYTGAAGEPAQGITEIPQRVGRLTGVPWVGQGTGGNSQGQIAPSEASLNLTTPNGRLDFFSVPQGTASSRLDVTISTNEGPTTVRKLALVGAGQNDFWWKTVQPTPAAWQTPFTLDSAGASLSFVFVPSALGERSATLLLTTVDDEVARVELGGVGTPLPGNQPGPTGKDGSDGQTGKDGATVVGPAGPAGQTGAPGPAGKDGTVTLGATRSVVPVKAGRSVTLGVRIRNATAGVLPASRASFSFPSQLRTSAKRSVSVAATRAGGTRRVTLRLTVGRSARAGTRTVRVTLPLGGRALNTSIRVKVIR